MGLFGWQRKRWGGCWSALSCFCSQKGGGKRIVPASRIPEGNGSATQPNGPNLHLHPHPHPHPQGQPGGSTQPTTLLAPPSSPASFSNSALPSTAQSPSCFLSLSANSPGGPSSTMFATGPYAHETQLVSPPVFSTFTTEPSTAPLTPPPELAHLTTPSSPDVPFAHFLSSNKTNYIPANDLQATYSLYPGSPPTTLISPVSRTSNDCSSSSFPDCDFPPQWDPSVSPQNAELGSRTHSGRLFGHDNLGPPVASQDSNFFCPATFAQFYLDNPPFPHSGGRLSVSKDSDVYSTAGNVNQSRQNKSPKQDADEIEAYRASFGFSADEIITTPQYVEISDVMEDSFTMTPFSTNKLPMEESIEPVSVSGLKPLKMQTNVQVDNNLKLHSSEGTGSDFIQDSRRCQVPALSNGCEDYKRKQAGDTSGSATPGNHILSDEEDIFSKMGSSKSSRKYQMGLSSSDAEIDYRRGRSLREKRFHMG
ncbi:hydroxyproline-rich glycoprotein family protein [Parasponia andersonii]|uniref:Hydroxyproline-rich glycoprotein family protein n=1 Tax=Parasponia andersonii TaxID=3476 RepID=A0A2P5AH92_PARAD|nr:hydroxyproline-rich glycoprotein family protein [Parasponia andersonii]